MPPWGPSSHPAPRSPNKEGCRLRVAWRRPSAETSHPVTPRAEARAAPGREVRQPQRRDTQVPWTRAHGLGTIPLSGCSSGSALEPRGWTLLSTRTRCKNRDAMTARRRLSSFHTVWGEKRESVGTPPTTLFGLPTSAVRKLGFWLSPGDASQFVYLRARPIITRSRWLCDLSRESGRQPRNRESCPFGGDQPCGHGDGGVERAQPRITMCSPEPR